jgi:hypothetical protein
MPLARQPAHLAAGVHHAELRVELAGPLRLLPFFAKQADVIGMDVAE